MVAWVAVLGAGWFAWGAPEAAAQEREPVAAHHSAEPAEPDAERGLFGSGKGPAEVVEDKLEEKTEEQKRKEDELRKIDDSLRDKQARVVVLEWPGSKTDYTNESLRRNIKARIARPNAAFFPEIDLYQEGRAEPDKTVRPEDQRASVPSSVVPRVMAEVEATAAIPFDAITEQDWVIKANELLKLADELWFVDRQELREPLFLLYSQIGRAAENSNQGSPPYFDNVDGQAVNYFWYLAGTLAYTDPTLLSKLTTQDLYVPIDNYRNMLDSGVFRKMTLSFSSGEDAFDPKAFRGEFELYVNGVTQLVTDTNGLLEVPLGRTDVYLKRADGYSISAQEERQVVPENYTLLLQIAKARMGKDFREQLMANPSECTPLLEGDIVTYLSIYAKLHPKSDVYIAVPRYGSTAPPHLPVALGPRARPAVPGAGQHGRLPVRFAAVIGAGLAFNTATLEYPTDQDLEQASVQPPEPGRSRTPPLIDAGLPRSSSTPRGVPIFYQLQAGTTTGC
ncbi:MAG: hypothetical protein R3F59_00485 [Myxococcota bacterium]